MNLVLILSALLTHVAVCEIEQFVKSPRKYTLNSASEKRYADISLFSERAPILHDVLVECGMSISEAHVFIEQHKPSMVMVEGAHAQAMHNLEQTKKVLEVMDESIREEYSKLTYQWIGPRALLFSEVSSGLGLTESQISKLKSIYYDYFERLAPANRKDFRYGMTKGERKEYSTITKTIEEHRDEELMNVLDDQQIEKWKRLLGEGSEALERFRAYCGKHN
ncbi:hypothetical protein [Coraliomargarita sinensis]|uniref:hypothetical protein n=1 Tax=Coraliomargarita sinensis TaxID=2174842 RepID=UPI0011B59852|nr:hypothetical protein [Coraliomargarita sinensis]